MVANEKKEVVEKEIEEKVVEVKKGFVIKGFSELKATKKAEIEAKIVNGDNISIKRAGGLEIISKIFLTYGKVQTIKKLAMKAFKTNFKNGKVSSDIDMSSLSEFRPDTDKGVQLLLASIVSMDGKTDIKEEDITEATDTEIIEKLLEVLLEENGLADKKADEVKNV